jgi:hypothetical protein
VVEAEPGRVEGLVIARPVLDDADDHRIVR